MLIKKTDRQIAECIEKHAILCEEKDYPHFAPANGVCWKCHRNIYQNYEIPNNYSEGVHISNGEIGEELITGCPHCHISYCD